MRSCLWVGIYGEEGGRTGDLLYEVSHVGQRIEVTAALMGEDYKYGYG